MSVPSAARSKKAGTRTTRDIGSVDVARSIAVIFTRTSDEAEADGRGDVGHPDEFEPPALGVDREGRDRVAVLVGGEEVAAVGAELDLARRPATARLPADRFELVIGPDPERGDRVVLAVRRVEESAVGMDADRRGSRTGARRQSR